ncbi:MAG: formylglycine-generating enzyme family protein [Roseiflexaceae bacterium]
MADLLLPIFINIPGVPFLIGSRIEELSDLAKAYGGTRESYREESPQHQLQLPAYAIAKTPVTNQQYAAFVAATGAPAPLAWRGPHPPVGQADLPVVDVTWHQAQAFCAWASMLVQQPIRLPSEAEWEHAARGTDGRRFPWGEEWEQTRAITRESGQAAAPVVASFPQGASPYGVLDMAGGVWEWTATLDRLYPYDPHDGREDPHADGRRILRGGCYANPHGYARCACRFRLLPHVQNPFLGFRLARTLGSPTAE